MQNVLTQLDSNIRCTINIPSSTFLQVILSTRASDYNFENEQFFTIKSFIFKQAKTDEHLDFQIKCLSQSSDGINFPDRSFTSTTEI